MEECLFGLYENSVLVFIILKLKIEGRYRKEEVCEIEIERQVGRELGDCRFFMGNQRVRRMDVIFFKILKEKGWMI